jgi:16S rRNA (cytosine1402-N4)-methyltransferase
MQNEVMELLNPGQSGIYIDATVGIGGHSEAIVRVLGSEGRLIGIDRDDEALNRSEKRLSDKRVILKKGSFADMESLLRAEGISEADGILFDLGVSMMQLKDSERGFSFLSDQRLDMRMDKSQKLTAWEVVNRYPEKELERIFREYGEDRLSRKIARAIAGRRSRTPIDTCSELSGLIESEYGGRGRLHPATRIFQALRIEVNRELQQLQSGLEAASRILKKGGRLCVISYHSLEDRIVKHFLSDGVRQGLFRRLTKKPMTPAVEEMRINPSSRSAKLRAAERI